MRTIQRTLFDWRAMGWNAYIPLVTGLVVLAYSLLAKGEERSILSMMEILLPAFSAWWSIFIFQDILDEPGGETLFSYPQSRWAIGLKRVLIFFMLYVLLITLILLVYSLILKHSFWGVTELQLIVQSLFFSALGYFLVVLLKSCSWAMLVTAAYVSFQVLTRGSVFPWSNLYFFHIHRPSGPEVLSKLVVILVVGLILLFSAQLAINRLEKFNE
ncbi:hypothetical protein [Saccharibacillus endophyticus]|uniref:ABC transporter permease n=1 Tax=Saccharibacillus endophyticus TaxID=2060666 RepID=A0ABQ1ZW95_9BACL|nr:hypothetical protein [Saccharibacillus endophyticus]GGH79253.1 hypothetical protein GCM10007362_25770 [Saccharibacillus endophyticus]